MHIYAFGSVCRGEIDHCSDIDLLACVPESSPHIDVNKFSVYQYSRLETLWCTGNPFAWHLYLEAKMIFSPDGTDFLNNLGIPSPYVDCDSDFAKFKSLFEDSCAALIKSSNSSVFHLSCIFLAIRNFATCYSLAYDQPCFSRNSPLMVNPSLDIDREVFSILSRARILSTRGLGITITEDEVNRVLEFVPCISQWMQKLESFD